MKIYKYGLTLKSMPTVGNYFNATAEMPQNAVILHIHEQHGQICIWAEVSTDEKFEIREFYVVPTGGDTSPDWIYLATVHNDGLVWHIFE
jgi:hypothetical protein